MYVETYEVKVKHHSIHVGWSKKPTMVKISVIWFIFTTL